MIIKKNYLNILINIAIAMAVAIYLINLPFYEFADRINYVDHYASRAFLDLAKLPSKSFLEFLFAEPLFTGLNAAFLTFLSPVGVVKGLIFLSSFLFVVSMLLLIDRNGGQFYKKAIFILFFFGLSFLFNKYTLHIRQGLAISLFVTSTLIEGKKKYFLLILTPLIHYSFYLTIPLYLVSENYRFFLKKFSIDIKNIIIITVIIFFFLNYDYLASITGIDIVQKYTYSGYIEREATLLGWFFWLGIMLLFFLQGEKFIRKNIFSILGIVVYLAAYFLFGSPARLLNNVQPFILLSGFSLPNSKFFIFILMMSLLLRF